MIVRMSLLSTVLFAMSGVCAQTATPAAAPRAVPEQTWTLPHISPRDTGPRTYQFTVDYNVASPTGDIIQRQRVAGEYTRGLPNREVEWHNVTTATVAGGLTTPYGPAQKRDFMEGFRYREDANTMAPDFFKSFPATAVFERNLVWDTGMFQMFVQNSFDKLELNVPFHADSGSDVKMPDVGTFHNRDIVLEWLGNSRRNGQDCALIEYRAFFNPVEIASGPMTMHARSDYWGTIWVSLATRQIEYATLNEEVMGQMKLQGQDAPQLVSVFRIGWFEPLGSAAGGK